MSPSRSGNPRGSHASRYIRDRAAGEGSELARVKDALISRGLSPRKRFGQNFLVREDIAQRIVDYCHLREDDVVVEIGPGAGALTGRIARGVRHLIAVEKDRGLAELLREELADLPRITLVEGGDQPIFFAWAFDCHEQDGSFSDASLPDRFPAWSRAL